MSGRPSSSPTGVASRPDNRAKPNNSRARVRAHHHDSWSVPPRAQTPAPDREAQLGVVTRRDSPYYWLHLERPGAPALRVPTKIPKDAFSADVRKQNRQAAQDVYAVQMAQLAKGEYEIVSSRKPITFATYSVWFETHAIARMRGAERELATLKHLRAFFGTQPLTSITRARAQEYITFRLAQIVPRTKPQRPVTANTVNRETALLKAMLRDAVPTYLKVSPLAGMKLLRVVLPKKRLVSPEEESRLLLELEPADRALYIVAVDTLLRLSNLINLRRDEDQGTHLAVLDSKTGPYEVPLSKRARRALDALGQEGPYFFPHRRKAENPRDWRNAIRLMLRRACARCTPPIPYGRAIGGITFHTGTRATGATRMLRAGHDPRTVQDVGHWRDIRSMQPYLQTDTTLTQAAVNRIGKGVRTPHARTKRRA